MPGKASPLSVGCASITQFPRMTIILSAECRHLPRGYTLGTMRSSDTQEQKSLAPFLLFRHSEMKSGMLCRVAFFLLVWGELRKQARTSVMSDSLQGGKETFAKLN